MCGFLCLTAGKEKKMQQKRRVRFLVCGVVFTALAALYFLIALMGAAINSDIDEGKTQEFADVVKDAGYAIPDAEGGVFRIRLSEKSAKKLERKRVRARGEGGAIPCTSPIF